MLAQDYIRLVLSRWRIVVALVLGCTLAAWLFSVTVLANDPVFESAARLNIVPTGEELGYANRFVRGSNFEGGSVLVQTYAEFAHTRPVVAPIVDRYIAEHARAADQNPAGWIAANTGPPALSPGRLVAILNYGSAPVVPLRDDMIDALIENTRIEIVEGTYLIRITVGWDDPESAAWFANALADAVIARADTRSRLAGTEIAESLSDRLAQKKAELAATLRQSRGLKGSLGVVDIDRQKLALLEAQVTEQSQLTSDQATLKTSESQVAGLRRQANGKLTSAQQIVEQTLATEAPRADGIRRGIAVREGRVAQIRAQIAKLGRNEDAVKALDDRAAALQTEVTALTERVSFSETENLANAPRIELVERAVPPLVRSSPKTLFNTALGFVAGCALAGCALLVFGAAPVRASEPVEDEPEAVASMPEPEPSIAPREPVRWREMTSASAQAAPIARAVKSEPLPVMRLVTETAEPIDESLVFHGRLPRAGQPAGSVRGDLVAWLADPLAEEAPLFVASDRTDAEAQALYQLLYDDLRTSGAGVSTIDGSCRASLAPILPNGRKPLVYVGGFGESACAALLDALPANASLVVAIAIRNGDDAVARLTRSARDLASIAGRPVHVVAIDG